MSQQAKKKTRRVRPVYTEKLSESVVKESFEMPLQKEKLKSLLLRNLNNIRYIFLSDGSVVMVSRAKYNKPRDQNVKLKPKPRHFDHKKMKIPANEKVDLTQD